MNSFTDELGRNQGNKYTLNIHFKYVKIEFQETRTKYSVMEAGAENQAIVHLPYMH